MCVPGGCSISAAPFLLPEIVRMTITVLCSRAVWLLVFVLPALGAQTLTVDVDPARTKIDFVLSDVLHTVHGTFRLKEGHLSLDTAANVITGDLIVDAASGNSGSATRDHRMTRDILEGQRYPEIRFTPKKFTGSFSTSSTSNIEVTGSFLIHGQAHEITIPMQTQVSQQEIIAAGKFIVPYVEWGMKNPSNFLLKVKDKVEIDLAVVAHFNDGHTR